MGIGVAHKKRSIKHKFSVLVNRIQTDRETADGPGFLSWFGLTQRTYDGCLLMRMSISCAKDSLNWVAAYRQSLSSLHSSTTQYNTLVLHEEQEAFEKCWAHSRLRAASHPFSRCRYQYCRAPPAHRCPRRQRQRRQQQQVTEGTAMAPWNGPNNTNTAQTQAQGRQVEIV